MASLSLIGSELEAQPQPQRPRQLIGDDLSEVGVGNLERQFRELLYAVTRFWLNRLNTSASECHVPRCPRSLN